MILSTQLEEASLNSYILSYRKGRDNMRILGFQKTTLLDYPHKLASTLFLGGCNFRCPFCQNALIVTEQASMPELPLEEVLAQLKKRAGVIEGICITGGEPTLYPELPELIHEIKTLGYSVKLDTNGSNPTMLKNLITDNAIDYVAMDIKNSPEKYSVTAGCNVTLKNVNESIHLLLQSNIPYEFRTTVVKELHTSDDFIKIGQWIHGASQYYLQNFLDSEHLICPNYFTSYDRESMEAFLPLLTPHVKLVSLRGID